MRTAETIANEIREWNKTDAAQLRDLIVELHEACDEAADSDMHATPFDAYVEMSDLPTAEIPADVDTTYPVWAMDASNRLLVGSGRDDLSVMTLEEYRAEKAA